MSCGLNDEQARVALEKYGFNEPREKGLMEKVGQHVVPLLTNPLILLLLALGSVANMSGDTQTSYVIWAMMLLAVGMQMFHELRSENAAEELRESLQTRSRVKRGPFGEDFLEVPSREIVPGDLVVLSAGELVPADGLILEANYLQVNQSRLTGESFQVKKEAQMKTSIRNDANILLAGSLVVSGYGVFRVERTGEQTEIGRVMKTLQNTRPQTRFDKDMEAFTMMMIRFIFILAPVVYLLQVLRQGFTVDAFMYAVSVSVGLAPEMLPMILTACLVHGASKLTQKYRLIIKRVNAMQALGTVDTLLTDKTGTLTKDTLSVNRSLDCTGKSTDLALGLAKLSAHFQQFNLNNSVEKAIESSPLSHFDETVDFFQVENDMPFDYVKRFSMVSLKWQKHHSQLKNRFVTVLQSCLDTRNENLVIYKGAVEEILAMCTTVGHFDESGRMVHMDPIEAFTTHIYDEESVLGKAKKQGERLLAVAIQVNHVYKPTLVGFISFNDPPKDSAGVAVSSLTSLGVTVRMLTGDTSNVASHVAAQVGIQNPGHVIDGKTIDMLPHGVLKTVIQNCYVFARLTPKHKEMLVREFQEAGHSVAFLGDGVNDLSALQQADVGISVDSACDASRTAADVLLTQKSLAVLEPLVLSGRTVFLNMVKYIKMAASSNFGNMFSVIGASLFIPFIPMQPIQIVTSNFLYDVAQLGIPTDSVDRGYLRSPLNLNIRYLQRFIVLVGFISSLFDFTTFGMLYYWLGVDSEHQAVFHTGWFVEGLLSQTLIVFVLRSQSPGNSLLPQRVERFFGLSNGKSTSSTPLPSTTLILLSLFVCVTAIAMPLLAPVREALGFSPLPTIYWFYLVMILISYLVLTQLLIGSLTSERKLLFKEEHRNSHSLRNNNNNNRPGTITTV